MGSIIDFFLQDLESVADDFIKVIKLAIEHTPNKVALSKLLSQLDFFDELVNLGYLDKVKGFYNIYDSRIEELVNIAKDNGVKSVGSASISDLEIIKDLDAENLLRRGRGYADNLKSELLKRVISGSSSKDITEKILPQLKNEMKYNTNWFASMLNTGYQNFNATATAVLFESQPNILFELTGPLDDRTRERCKIALSIQENEFPDGLTRTEINNNALGEGYGFINRGDFNCRHTWGIKSKL